MRSRNWVFTLNNPTEEENPLNWPVKYIVYQLEEGTNGTQHFQGYVHLENAKGLTGVKCINDRAHWEIRQGTHEQAVAYCTKEDTRVDGPWEQGDPPQQGRRSDLDEVKDMLDSGASELEVADSHFGSWVRYHRAFRAYRLLKVVERTEKTICTVTFGPTGTGKSMELAQAYPGAFWKPNSRWWDGYEGQEHVVIDEFYGWLPYDFLLRLCDRYPLYLETKGGTVAFVSKYIHFTSNQAPEFWYKHNFAPLERRLEYIYYKGTLEQEKEVRKNEQISYNYN
jgi:hypothetical protein